MGNFTKTVFLFVLLLILAYLALNNIFSLGVLQRSEARITYTYNQGAPRPSHIVAPTYPWRAYRKGIQGRVIVRLVIDKSGKVEIAQIVSSKPRRVFDDAALAALKKWEFPDLEWGMKRHQMFVKVIFDLKS